MSANATGARRRFVYLSVRSVSNHDCRPAASLKFARPFGRGARSSRRGDGAQTTAVASSPRGEHEGKAQLY
jgi:hypothetical protein